MFLEVDVHTPIGGEPLVLQTAEQDRGQRLDRFIAAHLPGISRAHIQELIRAGRVHVDHHLETKASGRLSGTETIQIEWAQRAAPSVGAEAIPLDIIYEDEDLAAVNKPAGLAVHPGAGRSAGTLVSALLHHFHTLSSAGGAERPGIVHRLDRLTSGVIVVAKSDFAHQRLAEQFQARTVEKKYIALVHGWVKSDSGRIDAPISRDLQRRSRMTTRRRSGRTAHTEFTVVERFGAPTGTGAQGPSYSLLNLTIKTGRTHQIRVHLYSIGHSVVGDRVYGAPAQLAGPGALAGFTLGRQFLHAEQLRLVQPRTGMPLHFVAPLAPELQELLQKLRVEYGHDGTPSKSVASGQNRGSKPSSRNQLRAVTEGDKQFGTL